MSKSIHGKIHGKIIELDEDPGIADGEDVEVVLQQTRPEAGIDGLRRCAGALAEEWTDEDDRILEMLRRDRKVERRTILE